MMLFIFVLFDNILELQIEVHDDKEIFSYFQLKTVPNNDTDHA